MEILIKKEDLFNGIKIVERATAMKGLQPVLANILIETIDKGTVKFSATDLDITVIAMVQAQVVEEGKITLSAKKLSEIVSKIPDCLINLKSDDEKNSVNITCQNTKYELLGISASEFPTNMREVSLNEENSISIELKPLCKAIHQAGFASALFEANNMLSGVVCDISENTLEIASTDGNRLAREREKLENPVSKPIRLIVPSKTIQEFLKMSSFINEDSVKIYTEKSKIIIKSENTMIISRLMEGQYPKYNQLIPKESPKVATIKIAEFISALERVSIMVNERTSIVKLKFAGDKLFLNADTPDSGNCEDEIEIQYTGDDELEIAFNYKYLIECLKNMNAEFVKIGLNTNLSATIMKPQNEEDYVCLVMPVQLK